MRGSDRGRRKDPTVGVWRLAFGVRRLTVDLSRAMNENVCGLCTGGAQDLAWFSFLGSYQAPLRRGLTGLNFAVLIGNSFLLTETRPRRSICK